MAEKKQVYSTYETTDCCPYQLSKSQHLGIAESRVRQLHLESL